MKEIFVIERMLMSGVWELFSNTYYIDEKVALKECRNIMRSVEKKKIDFTLRVTKLSTFGPN